MNVHVPVAWIGSWVIETKHVQDHHLSTACKFVTIIPLLPIGYTVYLPTTEQYHIPQPAVARRRSRCARSSSRPSSAGRRSALWGARTCSSREPQGLGDWAGDRGVERGEDREEENQNAQKGRWWKVFLFVFWWIFLGWGDNVELIGL